MYELHVDFSTVSSCDVCAYTCNATLLYRSAHAGELTKLEAAVTDYTAAVSNHTLFETVFASVFLAIAVGKRCQQCRYVGHNGYAETSYL